MADLQSLFKELWSGDNEDQVAFRRAVRYVPRLVRAAPVPGDASVWKPGESEGALSIPATPSFHLDIAKPGRLDALRLQPTPRSEPGPGQVEIEVYAAGLNYRDVLNAMGVYPGEPIPLGAECSGRIARVGEGVEGFQVGDEVLAIAPSSFARFATTYASLVVPMPGNLSFEEAATTRDRLGALVEAVRGLRAVRAIHTARIEIAIGDVRTAIDRGFLVLETDKPAADGHPDELRLVAGWLWRNRARIRLWACDGEVASAIAGGSTVAAWAERLRRLRLVEDG